MSRKVVVYTTNGGGKSIETDASTWGELKAQLSKTGITLSGMKAADNKKRSYEHDGAELPNDLTHMFLLPTKTKSGAGLSFSDARKFVTDAIAADGDYAKDHFNQGGKNYTQKSTAVLNELVDSYKAPKGKASAKATKAEPAPKAATKAVAKGKAAAPVAETKPERVSRTVAKTKSTTAPAKEEVKEEKETKAVTKKPTISSSTGNEIDGIVEILESLKGYNQAALNKAVMAVLELKVITEDHIDNTELNKMAREIASGFNDVKPI